MTNTDRMALFWIVVLLAIIAGLIVLLQVLEPMWRWALIAGVMILLLGALGRLGTTWGFLGALVDPQRTRYSLSQLQLVTWTVLVISAWLAIVATRIVLKIPEPLQVNIPAEVLGLLGISATSMVSATVIKSNQAKGGEGAGERQGRPGTLYDAAQDPAVDKPRPKWTDIFLGDQVGDRSYVDIGKFQMFWFTIAAVVAYGLLVGREITMAVQIYAQWDSLEAVCKTIAGGVDLVAAATAAGFAKGQFQLVETACKSVDCLVPGWCALTSLPKPDPSLLWVLGISHLGYLAYKVPPREEKKVAPVKVLSHQVGTSISGTFTPKTPLNVGDEIWVRVEIAVVETGVRVSGAKVRLRIEPPAAPSEEVEISTDTNGVALAKYSKAVTQTGDGRSTVLSVEAEGYEYAADVSQVGQNFEIA